MLVWICVTLAEDAGSIVGCADEADTSAKMREGQGLQKPEPRLSKPTVSRTRLILGMARKREVTDNSLLMSQTGWKGSKLKKGKEKGTRRRVQSKEGIRTPSRSHTVLIVVEERQATGKRRSLWAECGHIRPYFLIVIDINT